MSDNFTAVIGKMDEIKEKMNSVLNEQNEELKSYRSVSESSKVKLDDLDKRMQDQIEKLNKFSSIVAEMEAKNQRPGQNTSAGPKSLFNALTESKNFKDMVTSGSRNMAPLKIENLSSLSNYQKKGISGLSDLRDIFATLRLQYIVSDPLVDPTRIKTLFNVVQTKADTVEWLKEKDSPDGFTNNSSGVAEEGLKPTSALDFEIVNSVMTTLAHTMDITKQALSDLPVLEDHMNRRMFEGLRVTEDSQLLYGSGVGANIKGIFSHNILQQVQTTDTAIDTIRKAVTKIQNKFFQPDTILMHPNDWQRIELTKDTQDRYLFGNSPAVGAAPQLWRLPVIVSTMVNENNPLVGAFKSRAATIYEHDQAEMEITNSHASNFKYNIYTIRYEQRLLLAVMNSNAFAECVLGSGYGY